MVPDNQPNPDSESVTEQSLDPSGSPAHFIELSPVKRTPLGLSAPYYLMLLLAGFFIAYACFGLQDTYRVVSSLFIATIGIVLFLLGIRRDQGINHRRIILDKASRTLAFEYFHFESAISLLTGRTPRVTFELDQITCTLKRGKTTPELEFSTPRGTVAVGTEMNRFFQLANFFLDQCANCDYSLQAIEGDQCPECGAGGKDPNEMIKLDLTFHHLLTVLLVTGLMILFWSGDEILRVLPYQKFIKVGLIAALIFGLWMNSRNKDPRSRVSKKQT